jgi:hypothetical protein
MHYDTIKGMKSKVNELTGTVNKLEKLVNKVAEDVDLVDQQLTEAEACMPINKDGPLNSILKPFFVNILHLFIYYHVHRDVNFNYL